MSFSYEGIGQWAATFACENVAVGDLVKFVGDGVVIPCKTGDRFCGQVISCSKDGEACAVALSGLVTVPFSDEMSPGWNLISANNSTGIQEDGDGWEYLVVTVDLDAKLATIAL